PREAAAEAGASAGRAVLFAGLTVAISVTGLAFFGLDFVTKLGVGSALGVLTTVLIANSLLLAVLALLGHRIDRLKVPFLRRVDDSEAARGKTLFARWGWVVTEQPGIGFPPRLVRPPRPCVGNYLGARPPGCGRSGHCPEGADGASSVRPAGRRLRQGLQRPHPDRRRRERRLTGAAEKIYARVQGLPGVAWVRKPQFNEEK